MNTWLDSTLHRNKPINDWLQTKRLAARQLLHEVSWPTRKTEAWRYTSLHALEQAHFNGNTSSPVATIDKIPTLDSIDVIFIDGILQNKPTELPVGLSIVALDETSKQQQEWALKNFSNAKPKGHLFGLVNDVLATSGVLIDVTPDSCIDQPIRLVNMMTKGNEAHYRTLVRIGKAAQITIVEHIVGNASSFNTHVIEYELADTAQLEHYRLSLQRGAALNIGGSYFNLNQQSRLNSTLIGYGSQLTRIDIDINHNKENANAAFNAIYLLSNEEHFDLHSTIEHRVPLGTTNERVHGIVADKAHAVFNGRIHIHRDAQKTLAELNNRNLLLSREAKVNTKPELEIYADDVRCAHGATITEIDKETLYYLRSRGVSLAQAQLMLNFGFINELIEQIPNEKIATWLHQQLHKRFEQMNSKGVKQ